MEYEVLDNLPEGILLWHYTNHGGLTGLLQSKKLWFSHINFQNDAQEFNWFLKELYASAAKLYDPTVPGILRYELNRKYQGIFPVFTFSLTERPNLLSQWRGYCPNGGYCITFDPAQLNKLIKDNSLKVVKCIYLEEDSDQLNDSVRAIAGISSEDYNKFKNDPVKANTKVITERNSWFAIKGLTEFKRAAFYKHSAFSEEVEWRIVADFSEGIDYNKLKFRDSKGKAIPYMDYPICSDDEEVHLPKVIVGPHPDPVLQAGYVRMLLKERSTVTSSDIPYIHW